VRSKVTKYVDMKNGMESESKSVKKTRKVGDRYGKSCKESLKADRIL
jgi:hypothetical protein